MFQKLKGFAACVLSAAICIGTVGMLPVSGAAPTLSLADATDTTGGIMISNDQISTNNFKGTKYNNPISSDFYCADPTSVVYNGRLYLFGTNDHEQFEIAGPEVDNTYEKIKSFLIFSTDDMVNWTYHGEINVGEVAPWITNSWAPSIASRVEEDGKTHFYLYFSNNGLGTGVIHATDPLGPWDDPLGKPLVSSSTPGLKDCPNPFDPGVVIDENGDGWLSFGAGKASNGTDFMPGSARIVKLGKDMVSFDSDFVEIPAPYLFEASELNYINGTYVYTYCSDWADHSKKWPYDCEVPGGCGMVYMTTKTPLDSDSWEMKGECFVNPGVSGFDYSNNHTHMEKFKGNWYMFYHTLALKRGMGIRGSYRSMGVDMIQVDEETVTIAKSGATKKGPASVEAVNPFQVNAAADLNNTADIQYDTTDRECPQVISNKAGAWFSVKNVEFTASEGDATAPATSELTKTAIDSIRYNITVMDVDKDTTVSMYPATNAGVDCTGSVKVTGAGKYAIDCDMAGADGMMNMGYFKVDNDALITFVVDSITVNGKYEIDISAELTNTREWADGLRNVWNGFSDGDKVYYDDFAEFRYVKSDDAIEFFAGEKTAAGGSNAPLLDQQATFLANVKGKGRVEVRLDSPTGELLTSLDFDSADTFCPVKNDKIAPVGGTHDLYFVFSDANIAIDAWTFATGEKIEKVMGDVNADGKCDVSDLVMLQKWLLGESKITDWEAGDLQEDGKLNGFDLVQLRSKLLSQK